MSKLSFLIKVHLLVVLFCASLAVTLAQDKKENTPPNESSEKIEEDVLKISTNLIQLGVAVFDKKGNFINNLKTEDFELLVDGKPIPISFFERNTINNSDKTKQKGATSKSLNNNPDKPSELGRNIVFVVDDFHLSFASHYRVKKLISKFIERDMKPQDMVAIVSPTGQIGFLQQFTNDKRVLRAALERLVFKRESSVNDRLMPPMSEYEALLISGYDNQVTDVFAIKELGIDMESKRESVRSRARNILAQAAIINRGTYSTLEQVIRNSSRLAGRKVVFFFSDGFLLDPSNTNSSYLMRRITDAAARTNAVIYSFDAKGLEADLPEGTTASHPNAGFRVQAGARFESQDGLNLLADETGGHFIRNTNDLQTGLAKSLEEASQHYLLAWEPVSEDGKAEKLRKIKVSIRSRPDLNVRVQGGYLDEHIEARADEKMKAKKENGTKTQTALSIPEQQLNAALNASTPVQMLPTALVVNYADMPNEGMLLTAAMQIDSNAVEFTQAGDMAKANVDLSGIIYDSNGKREGFFRKLLAVDASPSALSKSARQNIYYNYQTKLKPGLYQMRVAARDMKSGRVGSAVRWMEIPDLSSRRLAMSSLILSERKKETATTQETDLTKLGAIELPLSVDRRFDRSSQLRYLVFIYNASSGKTGKNQADVTVQTQILQGDNIVVMSSTHPVSTEGQDLTRLQFAAEIPLNMLSGSRYELQVIVRDNTTKSSTVQSVDFEVK